MYLCFLSKCPCCKFVVGESPPATPFSGGISHMNYCAAVNHLQVRETKKMALFVRPIMISSTYDHFVLIFSMQHVPIKINLEDNRTYLSVHKYLLRLMRKINGSTPYMIRIHYLQFSTHIFNIS